MNGEGVNLQIVAMVEDSFLLLIHWQQTDLSALPSPCVLGTFLVNRSLLGCAQGQGGGGEEKSQSVGLGNGNVEPACAECPLCARLCAG